MARSTEEGEVVSRPGTWQASYDSPGQTGDPARTGKEIILLVEDDPSLRKLARVVLVREGYTVLEAGSGVEALEACAKHGSRLDMLVTDVIMPGGLNGLALATELKTVHPDLRVVFMSGYGPEVLPREWSQLHPNFLSKPYGAPALLAAVRRILNSPQWPSPDKQPASEAQPRTIVPTQSGGNLHFPSFNDTRLLI